MFRLLKVRFKGHPRIGNIELELSEDSAADSIDKPHKSILIGTNGVGKSFALRSIVEIFTKFEIYKHDSEKYPYFDFSFHIRYKIDGNIYDIYTLPVETLTTSTKRSKSYRYLKNYVKDTLNLDFFFKAENTSPYSIDLNDLEMPQKVLALSALFNDRFPFAKSEQADFYQYLGARATAGSSTTKTSLKRTIKLLFESMQKSLFKRDISEILKMLGYDPDITISFDTKYTKLFFSGTQTLSSFENFFENWKANTKRKTPPWGSGYFTFLKQNNPERLNTVIDFLNYLQDVGVLKRVEGREALRLNLNLFAENEITWDQFQYLEELDSLDILELNGICFVKEFQELTSNEMSSGESHLLISFLSIYSRLANDSLILIDEPELSLHPNWQMQYISFLEKVFEKYPDCHFILATHSHFLISNLKERSANICTFSKDNIGVLQVENINVNTFGWGPDEILFKIFHLKSTRNHFLQHSLENLVSSISYTHDKGKVKEELERIEAMTNISPEDPINEIIRMAKKYIGE